MKFNDIILNDMREEYKKAAIDRIKGGKLQIFPDITLEKYGKACDLFCQHTEELGKILSSEEITESKKWLHSYNRNKLHHDAFFGHEDILKFHLMEIQSLSDYHQKDDFGMTPVDYAEQQGHKEIVKLLKEFEEKRVKNDVKN